MKLVFSSIKNGTIFEPEFQNLTPAFGTIGEKHYGFITNTLMYHN